MRVARVSHNNACLLRRWLSAGASVGAHNQTQSEMTPQSRSTRSHESVPFVPHWRPEEFARVRGVPSNKQHKFDAKRIASKSTASGHEVFLDSQATLKSVERLTADIRNCAAFYVKTGREVTNEDLEAFCKRTTKLLSVCWRNGLLTEAIDLFDVMQSTGWPTDLQTVNAVIPVLASAGNLDKILALFETLRDANAEMNDVTFNSLIVASEKCGSLEHAEDFFNKGKLFGVQLDLSAYNALLHARVKLGSFDDAVRLFEEIQASDTLKPNDRTYGTLICAFTERREYAEAMKYMKMMTEDGLDIPSVVYNALIASYCQDGNYDGALEVVKMMKDSGLEVNQVTYTSMLRSCNVPGTMDRVNMIYETMISEGHLPDVIAYGALVHAATKNNDLERARFFGEDMIARNIHPDKFMLRLLMNVELKLGNLEKAEAYFEEETRNHSFGSEAFNNMLHGYSSRNMMDKFFALCERLLSTKVKVNEVTMRIVMTAFCKSPSAKRAELAMEVIRRGYKFERLLTPRECKKFICALRFIREHNKEKEALKILLPDETIPFQLADNE
eukprot:TRINITY_DN4865_c0_g1_i1.p1 TRINITY_DN4865_c0_g1~~TRINITY_DN4865_c0_g1_i1.p1  ORF type:complete len:558 (+),score=134.91 TRINITY_DN4865_c0_g1_i1:1519-3192(+)